ncbi:TlpA family protein disulfide reductase [Sphingobacterium phlebotomi]|uniref:TlpA family protein disulfide reductase n=1 Tax=Sphingobacterium phlebotomi TaxID=2605433 RepID=A0A5D4GY76_9SPHI|nr:TlpA disulfide reductase family protein [Sphingobacterium phlebotomi]TYR33358.1 TlpA family protein disulfide reductase [Sphingobacterium phlebotomi]
MRKLGCIILFFVWAVLGLFAQEIRTVKYEQMAEIIDQKGDKLTIVNFWATWCIPCIEEIPHFVAVFNQYKAQTNLEMIFVSLDRATHLKEVAEFIKTNKMPGEALLLDDAKRFNEWIPKVHPDWEGNLPATGFYRKGELMEFHANMLTEEELIHIIDKLK